MRPVEVAVLLAQIAEQLKRAAYRRYRPINATDDVVELNGTQFDDLLGRLEAMEKRMVEAMA